MREGWKQAPGLSQTSESLPPVLHSRTRSHEDQRPVGLGADPAGPKLAGWVSPARPDLLRPLPEKLERSKARCGSLDALPWGCVERLHSALEGDLESLEKLADWLGNPYKARSLLAGQLGQAESRLAVQGSPARRKVAGLGAPARPTASQPGGTTRKKAMQRPCRPVAGWPAGRGSPARPEDYWPARGALQG